MSGPVPAVIDALSPPSLIHISRNLNDDHVAVMQGHDMHAEHEKPMHPMLAILLIYGSLLLLVGAQTALFWWKKRHTQSYNLVTLIGLWLMPAIFSVQLKFWRFLLVWFCYSAVTSMLLYRCKKKNLDASMPRRVYSWFLGVYRVSTVLGVGGYGLLLSEAFGLAPLTRLLLPQGFSLDLLWYGLYFGVLGRDCAEVASSWMASTLRKNMNARINDCGVCGVEMQDARHLGIENEGVEAAVQLSCKHTFHDLCIRGWTMVGKKDMCPVCHEKVDLKSLYSDRPWVSRNLSWIQMLDIVRYMVVWNPVILIFLSAFLHLFGPQHHHHAGQHGADHHAVAEEHLLHGVDGSRGLHAIRAAASPPNSVVSSSHLISPPSSS
ncbi:hypothetical protein CEUSTIGMA_g6628.t1 [Chlamydomonas eustigma]|uniref:RING-type domain-containing protein n=1 Tax=Chlamydomonas eustigma TaxID=1157962 RepID=A0A250X7X8_9CHLO|nr:hypothetical protein CEUSTIGMA_g6628.t1 [Chlamydomonas eustigma]|eukprot:GAX79188.1 hypothetical protein CEUSTIGMA_g6628.t1 [Chlamydomonas eustigma]